MSVVIQQLTTGGDGIRNYISTDFRHEIRTSKLKLVDLVTDKYGGSLSPKLILNLNI